MAELTAQRLRELLDYDPAMGVFVRRVTVSNNAKAGSVVGSKGSHGYLGVGIDGTIYLLHRLAWLYMTGEWPRQDMDHVNRTKTDNRWDNLRAATRGQNIANVGLRKNNTHGMKGVALHKQSGLWKAEIGVHGRRVYLGYFKTKDEAGAAYMKAAAEFYGEFACLPGSADHQTKAKPRTACEGPESGTPEHVVAETLRSGDSSTNALM